LAVEGVKDPVELLVVKVMSPVGDDPVSVTAHVVNLPTFTDEGEHEREMDVCTTMSRDVEPLLPAFPKSPV
jgi:hypothetical protein